MPQAMHTASGDAKRHRMLAPAVTSARAPVIAIALMMVTSQYIGGLSAH
jgi:hypothetical protein